MSVRSSAAWILTPNASFDALQYEAGMVIPHLKETQCLVQMKAVSLNYRDIAMASRRYPLPLTKCFVPCSDAAGQIVAVGSKVTGFRVGDKVCMLFMQSYLDGIVTPQIRQSTLGSQGDGVLRQYGVFEETGLVHIPRGFSYIEASTLPCAAVTAWNCLFGLKCKALQKDDIVLTQGTGGVSLFAIQYALKIGAIVIATTSTAEKEQKLKSLGVHHVINYKSDPNWGETAKSMTPDGLGVHHVIEVGGESTISQAMKAIRPEGVVSMVGFLGGETADPATFSLIQQQLCIVRGMSVGSKKIFCEMISFLEGSGIKPIVSDRIFSFDQAKEAYKYMDQQGFWGKIVIKIC